MGVMIHTIYNPPPKKGIEFTDLSLTQQHFAEESDINNIMFKYNQTGYLVDPLNPGTVRPFFDDFSNDFDYQSAQNMLIDAQQRFMGLPAYLRKRFNNNPSELLEFLADPKNKDEAVRLGLVDAPATQAATPSAPSNQPNSSAGQPAS